MTRADREWLDLAADLLAAPLTDFPVVPIALRLRATFPPATVSFDERCPGRPRTVRCWPAVERRVERRVEHGLRTARCGRACDRLDLPVHRGPREHRVFVLTRDTPFSAAEVELARRLQRLIVGIDRLATALAEAGPAEPAAPEAHAPGLTPRELAVLTLVAHGLTAAAVARRLEVAERTVHKHLERVYTKLGVGDRVSAVLAAQRRGELRELDPVPSVLHTAPTG
jgi:DNA-binding CsgD family transcriptional regulator